MAGGYGDNGGGFDITELLKGIGGGAPWWAGPAAGAGASILGGLGGLFAGPSESQKKARSVYGLAQNRLGQSVMDPSQYMAQYAQSLAPMFNRQAEGINAKLGLDSGLAQQSMARGQQSTLSGILADLSKFNAQATANRDLGMLQLMLQAGGMS
jgi:hypothetical protein